MWYNPCNQLGEKEDSNRGDEGLEQAQPLSLHFKVLSGDFNGFFLKLGEPDRGRLID